MGLQKQSVKCKICKKHVHQKCVQYMPDCGGVSVCVCVCVRACVSVCVRAHVRVVCMCACVLCVHICLCLSLLHVYILLPFTATKKREFYTSKTSQTD